MASLCQGADAPTAISSETQVTSGIRNRVEVRRADLGVEALSGPTNAHAAGAPGEEPLVLVAGEGNAARQTLRRLLEAARYRVIEAETGRAALAAMSCDVDLLIANLAMPELSGRDCLRHVKTHHPDVPVILISRMGDVPEVVSAMKEGAFECFTRSCHPEQLLARVREATRLARLAKENRGLRRAIGCPTEDVAVTGKSPAMHALRQQIDTFARLDSNTLVTGAAGTGKTTVARWIHAHGARAEKPFVVLHCGVMPRDAIEAELFGQTRGNLGASGLERPGRVELADGGTLLFEEIGELPADLQVRLFHLLRDRTACRADTGVPSRVDVRVIATTTEDPAVLCRQGTLREDLLFRLDVLSLRMPLLKDHIEDIPDIAAAILLRIARRRGCPAPDVTPDAVKALQQYSWPGNARELEIVLDRAFALSHGSTITRKNLARPCGLPADRPQADGCGMGLAGFTLAQIERHAIIETMQACDGNKAKTARKLGVSEKTIYNKIKQYDLRDVV
jgi:DNA-binding NtrC family response regulator